MSGRPVAAVTVNHEDLTEEQAAAACRAIRAETGLPAHDVLLEGGAPLVADLAERVDGIRAARRAAAPGAGTVR